MIPATITAAAIAAALVPGYVFLQLTKKLRESTDRGAVDAVIELISVGVATTGLAVLGASIWRSSEIAVLADRLRQPPWDAEAIRDLSASIAGVYAVALSIAVIGGLIMRWAIPSTFSFSVWRVVFAERRNEHTWVRVDLTDGRAIAGALHGSDFDTDDGDRDILLGRPLAQIHPDGRVEPLPHVDRMVVSERKIRDITVAFTPRATPLRRSWPWWR